jgi:hypothetical protein
MRHSVYYERPEFRDIERGKGFHLSIGDWEGEHEQDSYLWLAAKVCP